MTTELYNNLWQDELLYLFPVNGFSVNVDIRCETWGMSLGHVTWLSYSGLGKREMIKL